MRKLESVPIDVANLGTTILGLEAGGRITINQTAAGFNWYGNAGGSSNQPSAVAGPTGESQAGPGGPAATEVDLLTVLEHELGHVLGLPDNDQAGDLMDITLGLAESRAPSPADVAAIGSGPSTLSTDPAIDAAVPAIVGESQAIAVDPLAVAIHASVPLPPHDRNRPRSSSANRPLSRAMVDAALASILNTAEAIGNVPIPPANHGTTAQSTGHPSRLRLTLNDKPPLVQSALRHPHGALSALQSRRSTNPPRDFLGFDGRTRVLVVRGKGIVE